MNNFKFAVIGDIHLGHPKNKTKDIIANLKTAFPDNSKTAELDVLFLAGDVFEGLFTFTDDDVCDINLWIAELCKVCYKHNIALRILEGTPSHDWKQSKHFINVAEILGYQIDIRYVTELSIEYMEKFDINILYVPDEWRDSTEKTLAEVHELLRNKGLDKVDYAIMHGAFAFQLPEFVKSHKHDAEEYLRIVKEFIFIAHIHTFNKYKRIIAQGSFDRLAHGEEEPKGYVEVNVIDGETNVVFVENKNAKIFKTINCVGLTLKQSLKTIDTVVKKLPNGSLVRVIGNKDNVVLSNMDELIRKYPLVVWSKLVNDDSVNNVVVEEKEDFVYNPITITSANIKDLLLSRVLGFNLEAGVVSTADSILAEVM